MPPRASKTSKRNPKPRVNTGKPLDPEDKENDPSQGALIGYIGIDNGQGESFLTSNVRTPGPLPVPQILEGPSPTPDLLQLPTKTCGQVRQMLRRYMTNTGSTIEDMQKELLVSAKDWDLFMNATGPKGGVGTDTYLESLLFFKDREQRGEPAVPTKAKAKAAPATAKAAPATTKRKSSESATSIGAEESSNKKSKTTMATSAKTKPKKKAPPTAADLAAIELSDEEDDDVPVYDTCDTVRRHISNFLRREGATQAQLCRDLTAMLQTGGKVQAANLQRFRNHRGLNAGATSLPFYAGYVFFEKLRIHEGKPKSRDREEMEDVWEMRGGFRRDVDANTRYVVSANRNYGLDRYGMFRTW